MKDMGWIMKCVVTYIVLLMATSSISIAQISQTLEFRPFDNFPGVRMAPRILSGHVYFETLPQPLKKTKVRLEIYFNSVANYVGDKALERDTLVHIIYSKRQMHVSDTLFVWPAPIYTNEPFTGEFEVTPLMSGASTVSIHLIDQRVGALEVRWCFDVDGNLHYLGNPADPNQKGSSECNSGTYSAIFFEGDSIAFAPSPTSTAPSYDIVNFSCVIKPPPIIEDTSTIICEVLAIEDIVDTIDIRVDARGVEVVDATELMISPLLLGQKTSVVVQFIPLPVNGPHDLSLRFLTPFPQPGQVIPLSFIFNDDGTLRFLGNGFNYNADIPHTYLPTAFQSLEEYEAAREEEKRVADSIRNADSRYFEGIR